MKKSLVIFGAGDIAQLAHYYFQVDSEYQVVAFVIDAEFRSEQEFCNLPLIAFEDLPILFPPSKVDVFVALSYSRLNDTRRDKYLAVKNLGYRMPSYISSHALVLNNGTIGQNCFILENNVIQPFVTIGENVTLWSGNHIGHHTIIHDHCFIASQVVISGGVLIGEQCFIGVNATLRDHISIGHKCVIGAGALILENAEPNGVYSPSSTARSKVPSTRLRNI
jgi:sugar O-acyltransferase (sialic acid O-acetyltransferase NeuD family)